VQPRQQLCLVARHTRGGNYFFLTGPVAGHLQGQVVAALGAAAGRGQLELLAGVNA